MPIGVFLVLYLGRGILYEYGLKVEMGFYSIPIVAVFLVAILVACFQNRSLSFDEKMALMGRGVGDKNIIWCSFSSRPAFSPALWAAPVRRAWRIFC